MEPTFVDTLVPWYTLGAKTLIGLSFVFFTVLLLIDAPYGRHMRPGWGPTLDARVGWIVMELVSPIAMTIVYVQGPHAGEPIALFFFAIFQIHYANRAIVQPMLARGGAGRRTTYFTVGCAVIFNSLNGTLLGLALGHVHTYDAAWLTDPRFVLGIGLFVFGAAVNVHADSVLRTLRRPGESGYRIPHGGLYNAVSCPNYLGEIIEWVGFAIATWSLAGLAFAMFTFANLAPRARANHRWYREHFDDYPPRRRALLPRLY